MEVLESSFVLLGLNDLSRRGSAEGKINSLPSAASCPLHVFGEGLWKWRAGVKSLWKQGTVYKVAGSRLPVLARLAWDSIRARLSSASRLFWDSVPPTFQTISVTDGVENTEPSHVSRGWYRNAGVQHRFINKSQVLENRPQEVCLRLIYRQQARWTMAGDVWRGGGGFVWSPSILREEPLTEKKDPGPYCPVSQQQTPPKYTHRAASQCIQWVLWLL